jgi:hypothetical protein
MHESAAELADDWAWHSDGRLGLDDSELKVEPLAVLNTRS